jgi:hypothetical protein
MRNFGAGNQRKYSTCWEVFDVLGIYMIKGLELGRLVQI